ncbi:hypothetical protein DITRI_Ditri08aG0129300 [Diplodiscus trichospermus]
MVWRYSKDGNFSAKSGYHIQMAESSIESPADDRGKRYWQMLWRTKVPNKVRIFGWRLFHDILPTNGNLCKRKIIGSPICQRCREEDETALHAIKECKEADEIWRYHQQLSQWTNDQSATIEEWLKKIAEQVTMEEFEAGLVLMWTIWNCRNTEIKKGERRNPQLSARYAKDYLSEYKAAQFPTAGKNSHQNNNWQAPDTDWIKVNFAGALNTVDGCGGIGIVARDRTGAVMGTYQSRVRHVKDPSIIEALAAVKALDSIKDTWFSKTVIEGDALVITRKLLLEDTADLSVIGNIIEEAKDLKQTLTNCMVNQVSKKETW